MILVFFFLFFLLAFFFFLYNYLGSIPLRILSLKLGIKQWEFRRKYEKKTKNTFFSSLKTCVYTLLFLYF